MDRESLAAAQIVETLAQPGDTIFIWGYRPGVVAYTRLPVGTAHVGFATAHGRPRQPPSFR